MQAVQANQLQSLRAAQKFLDDNSNQLPDVNDTGARRRLDALLAGIDECATEQEGSMIGGRGETRRYQALRRALIRDHMTLIARIAQYELTSTPELSALCLPRGNPSPSRLAAAARGMARAAAPHADVFIADGVRPDFIQRLTDATNAMMASHDARTQRNGQRSGATVGLAQKLKEGRLTLDVLTSFMRSAASDDAALLASWTTITRVRRIPRRTAAAGVLLPQPAAEPALLPPPTMKLLTSGEGMLPAESSRASSVIEALLKPFRRKAS